MVEVWQRVPEIQTIIEYLELFRNSLLADMLSYYDFTKKTPRFKGDKKNII